MVARAQQIERLAVWRRERDGDAVAGALQRVAQDATESRNIMPSLLDAVRAGATTGEMADALRGVFGEYRASQF